MRRQPGSTCGGTAKTSYEATREERIAQEQTLSAENERPDVGASSYFVLQFQRDLAAAKSNEISSLAAYQEARAALARVSGQILTDYHVEFPELKSRAISDPAEALWRGRLNKRRRRSRSVYSYRQFVYPPLRSNRVAEGHDSRLLILQWRLREK